MQRQRAKLCQRTRPWDPYMDLYEEEEELVEGEVTATTNLGVSVSL